LFAPSRATSLWYVVTPARSVTAIVAVALFVASTLLVAVIVIPLPGEFGATYVAVVAACALNVPDDAVHVTPAPPTSFATVALTASAWFNTNPIAFGEIVTATPAGGGSPAMTVIVAELDFVPSVAEVAVSVTVAGLGTVAGAVYVIAAPEALVVADNDPHPLGVAHDAAHVTPFAALSFATVAVKLCVALVATDAVAGDTVTAIPIVPLLELDPPPHPANTPITVNITAPNKVLRTRHAHTRITKVLR
jgi:hypothetical protein